MSRTKWIIGLLVILLLAVATGVGEGFRGGRRGGGRRGGGRRHGWEWEEDTGTVQGGPTGRTSGRRDSMEPAKTAAQALETELGDASIQA